MGAGSSIPAVEKLEIERFMGDWWVIANIPLPLEKPATNALEQYKLVGKNRVDVTFSFNDMQFDGPKRVYHAKAFVSDNPARWGVQFFWPIKAEYVVSHIDPNYQTTIIARSRRDYVWIMARSKTLDDVTYNNLVAKVKDLGYDVTKLNKVLQDKT